MSRSFAEQYLAGVPALGQRLSMPWGDTLRGTIKDSFTGAPVANALVATDTVSATTAADGSYTLANVSESFALTVSGPAVTLSCAASQLSAASGTHIAAVHHKKADYLPRQLALVPVQPLDLLQHVMLERIQRQWVCRCRLI